MQDYIEDLLEDSHSEWKDASEWAVVEHEWLEK